MKKTLVGLAVFCGLMSIQHNSLAIYGPKVTENGNKHNLSYGNTGVTYKASNASDPRSQQVCIFCHTPHNAVTNRGLWNRVETTQVFGQYTATSLRIRSDLKSISDYNEPNGASRLCLSCHDGVTALGAVAHGGNIAINGGLDTAMSGVNVFDRAKVTNSHHPVSFNYARVQSSLVDYKVVPSDSKVKLDGKGRMQCTTCHDPHQTRDTTMPFWVWDYIPPDPPSDPANSHDAVCVTCHQFPSNVF